MIDPPSKLLFRLADQKWALAIASLIAIVAYLLAFPLRTGLRIGLAYDLAVSTFLGLQAYRISRITAQDMQDYYENREPSSRFIVMVAVLFSSLSLVGVGFMVDVSKNWSPIHAQMHTGLSLLAVVLSWIVLHVFYAFFYAHLYYDVDEAAPELPLRKGLVFPNNEPPDYWDFLYYSFTIAMCYQTSDVTVSSRSMRRTTLGHAIISFLFVTSILGLVINILSNLI